MSPEAIAELRRRADAGDPEAVAFTAVLAAFGVGEPQDWPAALRRLARAADLGSAPAREQLAVLADVEPAEDASWPALAASIDLAAWVEPAAKERRLLDPRISVVPSFLTPRTCAWLIARAGARLAKAQVFDPRTGGARQESTRTNNAFEFAFEDLDLVLLAVRARIAATAGTLTGALEPIQVLHYAPGQTFERHYDFLDPATPGYAREAAARGQRVATFLVYLNADYEGGETDFPAVGFSYRGRVGDALMFANVDRTGAPDRQTLHAGLPPRSGEKWLLSQWVRDRASL
ncbi:MAG: hypothetical protein JWQ46_2188 [Phenylobacterium sp.]|jgi:prolyl 4-hydroxylase|nr:hypothetical protein [Phenylobacterium sp.]